MSARPAVNMYLRVSPSLGIPGHSPPSGPAIQRGKKSTWVVGERPLGRSAAITTSSRLSPTIEPSAIAPTQAALPAPASAPARRLSDPPRRAASSSPRGASRSGSVVASPCMSSVATIALRKRKRARRSEPSQVRFVLGGSDRLDVHCLGTLLALLRVVGDLRPLLQRTVSLAVDAGVMDEEVLVAVVGGD